MKTNKKPVIIIAILLACIIASIYISKIFLLLMFIIFANNLIFKKSIFD
jgi:hypothetical protein